MTLRSCIYKNCDNYINIRDRTFNEHITLFNFPKNPERRQIWMENGRAPLNLSPAMYCYCSDHFDKRFLAINNRRTVLVGEAVPYPFEDQEVEENYDDENLDCYLYEMKEEGNVSSGELIIEQEHLQEQDIHVESTTSLQGEEQAGIELINNEFNVNHLIPESASNQYIIHMENGRETKESNKSPVHSLKRKLNDNIVTLTTASSSKQMMLKKSSPTKQQQLPKTEQNKPNIIKTTPSVAPPPDVKSININQQTDHNIGSAVKAEIDPDSLVDTQYVTTFIFKGEEYVQMPRDHYIKEKMDLMKKLYKMERVIKSICNGFSVKDPKISYDWLNI